MVWSLRSVRYVAAVACAPWVVMAQFKCSVNYNTKTGNPECNSITEAGCSDYSCCQPVDNCTAYTCASPLTKKTAVPTGTCTDCVTKCCEIILTTCALWQASFTATLTESCSEEGKYYDEKLAATSATTAAEFQTKCCAAPTTCEAWRKNAGEKCNTENYEDKAKYAVAATTTGEYATNCCTKWSKCEQFVEYDYVPVLTAGTIYDPSKASTAVTLRDQFQAQCTSTTATCSASACTSNLYELVNPVPTSKCAALTCTQWECCKTKATSCLSTTCKSSLARDDTATYSGKDAEHEAACCKEKFSCAAAGKTMAADINAACGGSSPGSGVLAAAIAIAAIGFMSK